MEVPVERGQHHPQRPCPRKTTGQPVLSGPSRQPGEQNRRASEQQRRQGWRVDACSVTQSGRSSARTNENDQQIPQQIEDRRQPGAGNRNLSTSRRLMTYRQNKGPCRCSVRAANKFGGTRLPPATMPKHHYNSHAMTAFGLSPRSGTEGSPEIAGRDGSERRIARVVSDKEQLRSSRPAVPFAALSITASRPLLQRFRAAK